MGCGAARLQVEEGGWGCWRFEVERVAARCGFRILFVLVMTICLVLQTKSRAYHYLVVALCMQVTMFASVNSVIGFLVKRVFQ